MKPIQIHSDLVDISEKGRETQMSTALWCDKGGHAFSAKDPKKQHFTQTRTVSYPTGNSYGRTTYQERKEVTEELDICGPCWAKANPFSTPNPPKAEIEENEEYLRGYHDAKNEG
jgi:hypothetical protein